MTGTNSVTAAPSRQKERTELSTARLLDAAGELITSGGYAAMTLAAVGERAGYSRGLATARFGSKDKLLEALIERIVTRWSYRNVLPRKAGRPGREQVLAQVEAIGVQADRDTGGLAVLYALVFESLGPIEYLHERFVAFHREMRSDLMTTIRQGMKDGSIAKDVDAAREAELIVAELRGIAYQWRLDPDGFDPAATFRYLVAAIDRRLTP
jgi:AcrR family transcriptional regulator